LSRLPSLCAACSVTRERQVGHPPDRRAVDPGRQLVRRGRHHGRRGRAERPGPGLPVGLRPRGKGEPRPPVHFAADVDPDLAWVLAVGSGRWPGWRSPRRPPPSLEGQVGVGLGRGQQPYRQPDVERFGYQRAGMTVIEIESSHLVMLSHPKAVADLIRAAITATTAEGMGAVGLLADGAYLPNSGGRRCGHGRGDEACAYDRERPRLRWYLSWYRPVPVLCWSAPSTMALSLLRTLVAR
jgi:hypothetical protein